MKQYLVQCIKTLCEKHCTLTFILFSWWILQKTCRLTALTIKLLFIVVIRNITEASNAWWRPVLYVSNSHVYVNFHETKVHYYTSTQLTQVKHQQKRYTAYTTWTSFNINYKIHHIKHVQFYIPTSFWQQFWKIFLPIFKYSDILRKLHLWTYLKQLTLMFTHLISN